MQKRVGLALVSALAIGAWACSSPSGPHGGGTGGDEDTGGSSGGDTGGKSGGDTGGKQGGTGGSTGGSTGNTGGAGDTGGKSGGDTGGSTGNTGGSGGKGGVGGSAGGAGGSAGGAGGGGAGGSGEGGMGGVAGGELTFNALGLNPVGYKMWMAPTFPKPMSHCCGDHSPAMEWTGDAPAGTMSWAITLIDTNKQVTAGQPVVPNTSVKVHFSYYDIPLATRALKADLPHATTIPDYPGMKASANFSGSGWFGPGAGGNPHIYILSLWPLNVAKLAGAGSQQGTYDAITKAAIGKPKQLVIVGTNDGL